MDLSESYSVFEVGRGESISIKHFIETSHQLASSKTKLQFGALSYRDSEIMDSYADVSALAQLGWCPKVDLEDGIQQVIDHLIQIPIK